MNSPYKETINGVSEPLKFSPLSFLLPRIVISTIQFPSINEQSSELTLKTYSKKGLTEKSNIENTRFDLRRRSLKGAQLVGLNLNNALFLDSTLDGANFSYSSLEGANFTNAKLKDATFESADLKLAIFNMSDLTRVDFNSANLVNSDFTYSVIEHAYFGRSSIQGANLNAVKSSGAIFSFANLQNTNLAGGVFKSANFEESDLKSSDLREAQFQGASFKKAKLQASDMQKSSFQGANFDDALLHSVLLIDSELQGASLRKTSVQGADLTNVSMQGAVIDNTNFNGAILRKAKMFGAIVENAQNPIGVQNDDIDFETDADWQSIMDMSSDKNYRNSIQNAKKSAGSFRGVQDKWFIYDENSLSNALPEICQQGYKAVIYSLNNSKFTSIDYQRAEYNPSEPLKIALKNIANVNACKAHLDEYKKSTKQSIEFFFNFQ